MRVYATDAPSMAHDVACANSIRSLFIPRRLAYSTLPSAHLCKLSKTSKALTPFIDLQATAGQIDTDMSAF